MSGDDDAARLEAAERLLLASAAPDIEEVDAAEAHPYASEANKARLRRVAQKQKDLARFIEERTEHSERISILSGHLKNVQQELSNAQSLLDAKASEIASEKHMSQIAEREAGRLDADWKRAAKEAEELQEQNDNLQTTIFEKSQALEKAQLGQQWNAEEYLQWGVAAKQKQEDLEALQRYEKMDMAKINALVLKVEKAAAYLQTQKTALDALVTESRAVQIELEKTSLQYESLHNERQELIKQWNESMNATQRRDQAITQVAEEIALTKADIRERERETKAEGEFLSREQAENKRLTTKIEAAERTAEKKRLMLHTAKEEVQALEDQLLTHRNKLEKEETELRNVRGINEQLRQQHEDKQRRLQEFVAMLDSKKTSLGSEYRVTDDLAMKSKQVEQLNAEHKEEYKRTMKRLAAVKDALLKQQQAAAEELKRETDAVAEIAGAQGSNRNMKQRLAELDLRSVKQQELLYNIEFQIQAMERKVSRAQGKRTSEETQKLTETINNLTSKLEQERAAHANVVAQVKRLHEELRAARRTYESVTAERDTTATKIGDLELETDTALTQLRDSAKQKEEMVVAHDVRKLDVKKLRDTLNQKADEVLELKRRQAELALNMKQREREIDLHTEVQRAEKKVAEEARHKLTVDLNERQLRVEKLKAKFDAIAGKTRKEGEEEKTQAYYIIQAAQEKQELQKEGDELNEAIKKSEKEIKMLAKTFAHLAGAQAQFASASKKADESGDETRMLRELEEQLKSVGDSLFKKKAALREAQAETLDNQRSLETLMERDATVKNELVAREEDVKMLQGAMDDLRKTFDRAVAYYNEKKRLYRSRNGVDPNDPAGTVAEQHISLMTLRRKNKLILSLLASVAKENASLAEQIGDTMEEAGMSLADSGATGGPDDSRPNTSASYAGDYVNRGAAAAAGRPLVKSQSHLMGSRFASGPSSLSPTGANGSISPTVGFPPLTNPGSAKGTPSKRAPGRKQ